MTRLVLPSNIGSTIVPQITKLFSNIFKSPVVSTAAKKTGSTASTVTKNIAITGGTLLGTTAISSYFLSTPQGQNTLDTANNFANLGGNITGFLSKNPIVPIGLLILGGLIVVGAMKK